MLRTTILSSTSMRNKCFKIIYLILFFSSFIYTNSALDLQPTDNGYLFNYSAPEITIKTVNQFGEESKNITSKDTYTQIILTGNEHQTEVIGMPQLPTIQFLLIINNDGNQPEFKVTSMEKKEYYLTNHIYPTQEKYRYSDNNRKETFTINKAFYSSSGKNEEKVHISKPYEIRGVKFVQVSLNLFSYNPLQKKLTLAKEISVHIKTGKKEKITTVHSSEYKNIFRYSFLNFKDMIIPIKNVGKENYLIISSAKYSEDLNDFITFKQQKYNVKCVTTDITGTSMKAIQNFIKSEYNNPVSKPTYLLLVGDINDIPASTPVTSDNPYSDMNNDNLPDILTGRFSVSNSMELKNIITKTIYMENNIAKIKKRALFISNFPTSTEPLYFSENNFECFLYKSESVIRDSIKQAINKGVIFSFYKGHSSQSGWPRFGKNDILELNNSVFPFVFSYSCYSADYNGECFGESFIRSQYGAVSYFGSTRTTFFGKDEVLERGIYDALSNGITGISALVAAGLLQTNSKMYYSCYNLLGDPSLHISENTSGIQTKPNIKFSKKLISYKVLGKQIIVSVNLKGIHKVSLLNLQGKTIDSFSGTGSKSYSFVKPVASGIYLFKLSTNKKQQIIKVLTFN